MNLYKKIKDKEKVNELEQKYSLMVSSDMPEMSSFSFPIPQDGIRNAEKEARNFVNQVKNPYEVINCLINNKNLFPDISEVNKCEKGNTSMLIGSLFLYDDKGHLSKKAKGEKEIEKIDFWRNYDIFMIFESIKIFEIIKNAIIQEKLDYILTMQFICEKSWTSRKLTKSIFNGKHFDYYWINELKQLLFFFFDEFAFYLSNPCQNSPKFRIFIDCVSIKIEGLIRDILSINNISTFKISKKDNTAEEGNINTYLRISELEKILSLNEIAYLQWLLVEKKSLRNKVAHCLMLPEDYNIFNACLLLVAFLRLCKTPDEIIIKNG